MSDSDLASIPPCPPTGGEPAGDKAARLWRLWEQGQAPALAEFLSGVGPLGPLALAAVLRIDQRQRWLRGQRITAEEYLRAYPAVAQDEEAALDVIYAEFLLRRELGEAGSSQEFLQRFPLLAGQLCMQFDFGQALAQTRTPDPGEQVVAVVREAGPAPDDTPGPLLPRTPPASAPEVTVPNESPSGSLPARLAGYDLLVELGRGGMGIVYKARHRASGRIVALKRLLNEGLAIPETIERFRLEARAAAELHHPGIVPVYDIGVGEGVIQHYFTMAYLPGGSLQQALAPGPVAAAVAARLVQQVAEAVQHAHDHGIIHRDIKPHNILLQGADLTADGFPVAQALRQTEGAGLSRLPTPLLSDFGLAHLHEGGDWTRTGEVRGTPSYMPPEQASGDRRRVGPRSDVYSLGAVLYCLLTGRPPFQAANVQMTLLQVLNQDPVAPRQLNPAVPRDLETVCLKCLSKDPERRYATAQELAEELARFQAGLPVRALPMGRLERAWRWCRRNRAVAGLLAGLVLTLLLGTGVATWFAVRADAAARKAREEAGKAREAQQKALAEKEEKDRQLDRAERVTYFSQITLAQREWQYGDPALAWHHLESCQWNLRGWEHDYLYTQFTRNQRTFHGHKGLVCCVAYSPDGKRIVSGTINPVNPGNPGELKVWAAATGTETFSLKGHTGPVWCVAYSPDGKYIVSGSGDSTLKVWDAHEGKELFSLKGHSGMVYCVAYSPDGKRLVSGTSDIFHPGKPGELKVWDADKRTETLSLKGHTQAVTSVAFNPDGRRLVSASYDSTLTVWDADTGTNTRVLKGHTGPVGCVAFRPDGKRFVSASTDGTLKVWDPDKASEIVSLKGHTGWVTSVAYSPDGKQIASTSYDQTVKVWDADTGTETLSLKGHKGPVSRLAYSPDGKHLVSGSYDSTLKVWDADKGQQTLSFKGHTNGVRCVAYSPDGKHLVSGGGEPLDPGTPGELKVWDADTGQQTLSLRGHTGTVCCVAYRPDGKHLVSGGDPFDKGKPGELKVWDADTGVAILALRGHKDRVFCVAYSPDGKRIVSGGADPFDKGKPAELKVWDADTGVETLSLHGHTGPVLCVAYSPDGKRIVSGSQDKTLKMWDTATGTETLALTGHSGTVWCVAFSHDGKRLVSGSADNTLKVWDADTGTETLALNGHTNGVRCVACSPDGKRLVSGGGEPLDPGTPGELKVWDAITGQQTLSLRGHTGPVYCVAFRPDGKRLVSASEDKTLRVWDADKGQEPLSLNAHKDLWRALLGRIPN